MNIVKSECLCNAREALRMARLGTTGKQRAYWLTWVGVWRRMALGNAA